MKDHKPTIITLTTDFGLSDEYVGVMKGVIYAKAPEVNLVDLSHAIPSYDVRKAAYLIASAYRHFPPGTIHIVVVDPGVGGDREIILLQTKNHLFLAPDNGVLSLIIKEHKELKAFRVTNRDFFLDSPSPTFHGRDIFAPVAAHLARGAEPMGLGPEIQPEQLNALLLPEPAIDHDKRQITGTVIGIDHFGNLLTNIPQISVREISSCPDRDSFSLSLPGDIILPIKKSYQEAAPGEVLILFNSRNYLEIAVNLGNAAIMLNLRPDDQILLKKISEPG